MSSARACVRFPDGNIRYGIYHGTSDVMQPNLYNGVEEAWADRRAGEWRSEEGEAFPVVIWSDYGGGFGWPGVATKDRVLYPLMLWDECVEGHVLVQYQTERVSNCDHRRALETRFEGHPDWVPWDSWD